MFSTDQSHLRRYLATLGVAIAAGTLSLAGLFMNLQQDMQVTKSTLAQLTPTARGALLERQHYMAFGTSILPYFILAGFLGGLTLAAYGLIGWARRQRITDALEDLELKKGQVELRKMTDQEQAEELNREAEESADDVARASSPQDEQAIAEVKQRLVPDIRNRTMILERSLVDKLASALGSDNIQTGIRAEGQASRITVDAIAQLEDLNFVFELKYAADVAGFRRRLSDALIQVDRGVNAVMQSGARNVFGVIMFIIQDSVGDSELQRLIAYANETRSRLKLEHRVLIMRYSGFLSISPDALVVSLFKKNGPAEAA